MSAQPATATELDGAITSISTAARFAAHAADPSGAPEQDPAKAVVVVGVDGSPASLHALREATPIVKVIGGRVVVVFARPRPVVVDETTGSAAVALTAEAADEIEQQAEAEALAVCSSAGVAASFIGCDGDPGRSLIDVAHEVGASCVVVGANIHGAISSLFLSSVAEYLLHHYDLSLVIVRPEAPEVPSEN
jgi:nucleotide-binding universal stress UspA family protein